MVKRENVAKRLQCSKTNLQGQVTEQQCKYKDVCENMSTADYCGCKKFRGSQEERMSNIQ
jgi:hypothetical protein